MTQMFIFTAGNPEARQHLVNSIENPIDDERVFGSFASAYREELERMREEGNGFYAWGAVPGEGNLRNWEAMERDDYVLCVYSNAYHYAARVLAKYDNRRFAQRVWGTNHEGKTWQYMYFLTKPDEVYGRVPAVSEYLNQAYLGFTRIADAKVDEILNDFGSVDNFIHQMLNGPESGVGTAYGLGGVTERDMEELEDAEDVDKTEVDREMETIRDRLEQDPELQEGLDRQNTQTRARPRSAAFEISVKRLYGFRCAICGSGLRSRRKAGSAECPHIPQEIGWQRRCPERHLSLS